MNISLCGFMGCGKTTVGKRLALLLGARFVDMDAYIEASEKMKVTEIFNTKGEPAFRSLETKAAAELSSLDGLIVATGGGAVLNAENTRLLKKNGVIVYLDVPLATIKERLLSDTTRPLLNSPDKSAQMARLFAERAPVYSAAADFPLSCAGLTSAAAADKLAEIFREQFSQP